jgi:hypothetical protein
MKKIVIMLCFFLISIDQKDLPTQEKQQRIWERADNYAFSQDFLIEDSKSDEKLNNVPDGKVTEDILAKYYSCFGEGCVHIFKNKSGSQAIVLVTMTDQGLNSMDIFEINKITEDLYPFDYPFKDKICPLSHTGCVKITDKKKFFRKTVKYATIISDKYFSTKKGIKLGMTYNQVIKILGKPDKKKIDKKNKAKVQCYWEIYVIDVPNQYYAPLEGEKLKAAIKAKEDVFMHSQERIEFNEGKVERIHLYEYWPG